MEHLNVFKTVNSLRDFLSQKRSHEKISLVPTMGALHHGHIELIKQANEFASIVVVSIFVNPTQFNNSSDLAEYPRMLESDLQMLSPIKDVVVFAPEVNEVYPPDYEAKPLFLGEMESEMEGKFRPGHFRGVVNVVKRLFDIVEPDYAFFGEKDYQQLAIIQYMARSFELNVQVFGCPTVREQSGLASSSRNYRLSPEQWVEAEIIYQTMHLLKESTHLPLFQAIKKAKDFFNTGSLKLEYLEVIDPTSLKFIKEWTPGARVCIAAFCDEVRLIDNMELIVQEELVNRVV